MIQYKLVKLDADGVPESVWGIIKNSDDLCIPTGIEKFEEGWFEMELEYAEKVCVSSLWNKDYLEKLIEYKNYYEKEYNYKVKIESYSIQFITDNLY